MHNPGFNKTGFTLSEVLIVLLLSSAFVISMYSSRLFLATFGKFLGLLKSEL